MSDQPLEELARRVVRLAQEKGAAGVECTIAEGDEFTANVRMREVENLKEAGSRVAGLRVLVGQRTGSAYTSDLSAGGVDLMVRSALELAAITGEDPYAGLPEEASLGSIDGNLRLFSDDVRALDTEAKIDLAREAEAAALDFDPRIANSEGASFDSATGHRVFANSLGFAGSYRASRCSMSVMPVAKDGKSMERDYWFTQARSASGLDAPAEVGRIAAGRAIRRLHSRKLNTRKAPVVFDPLVARSLLGHIFEAINGNAVYRKASFLAGKLGEKIASENLTVIDDGTLPGLFGTSPFDDEGVPSRRTPVIEKGVLESYLLNSYTARKLGLKTTGNASRGVTGNAGVGHGNLFAEKGNKSPEELIKGVDDDELRHPADGGVELSVFGVSAQGGAAPGGSRSITMPGCSAFAIRWR